MLNWNRLSEVKETIELVSQSNIETEIIVYDQSSTDGSVEYLKSLDMNNLTVIYGSRNVGNSISRNVMIRISKHDFILFLDGDIVPIKNSIESMYKFMIDNSEFSFIGYNFQNSSSDRNMTTPFEGGIGRDSLYMDVRIALTQYGMFRKCDLIECPFPEFEPFNMAGWGAEDDIVGMAIIDSKIGRSGMIMGRHYYHNHPKSSWKNIGSDVHRLYALRYITYRFFEYFLNPNEKIKALQSSKLPIKTFDITQYYYKDGDNLGDVALFHIFRKIFPFIKFKNDSSNLLMFGGSVFEHLGKAEHEFNRKFLNVEYFGVGCHNKSQSIDLPNSYNIHPRGYESQKLLESRGIKTNDIVGDVLQLFSLLPDVRNGGSGNLIIHDVYSNSIDTGYVSGDVIRIAKNGAYNDESIPYYSYDGFLSKIRDYEKIHSSQIHPFLIAVMLGKSSKLIPKDIRSLDFLFFKDFLYDMNYTQSLKLRTGVQQSIPKFVDYFFNVLKNYIYTDKQDV